MQLIKTCLQNTSRTYWLVSSQALKKLFILRLMKKVHLCFAKHAVLLCIVRKLVKQELDRLAQQNIITKVFKCEWACPTVNVMKPDGTVRIYGDYSLTVNKCMKLVKYPLPSVEDVFTLVGDAKVFSKIHLESAYLQLPLDDESKVLTTVNITEGLYQFNYLLFGISSSPGIFQSFMCKVLSDIDNIIIYQDDILIMTSTKHQHDIILDKVV